MEKLTNGEARSGFTAGDRIEIEIGPFAGLAATYMGEANGQATVLVSLFGRETPISVPLGRLPIGRALAA